jgi:hypothetical protein
MRVVEELEAPATVAKRPMIRNVKLKDSLDTYQDTGSS